MAVFREGAHVDLGVADPSHGHFRRGPSGCVPGAVDDQNHVRPHQFRALPCQGQEDLAPGLLLSLDQEAHIHCRPSIPERGFDGLYQGEELPLVVRGTPGVEVSATHLGAEGRAQPRLQWVGRLHVVVAVDEDRGSPRDGRALAVNHGVGVGAQQIHLLTAQAPEMLRQPQGRSAAVAVPGWIGGHAGDAKEVDQLAQHAVPLARDEGVQVCHDAPCS